MTADQQNKIVVRRKPVPLRFGLGILAIAIVVYLMGLDFVADGLKKSDISVTLMLALFLLAGCLFVYRNDPYTKSKILHPKTHATICLLLMSAVAMGAASIVVKQERRVVADAAGTCAVESADTARPGTEKKSEKQAPDEEANKVSTDPKCKPKQAIKLGELPSFIWMAFIIGTLGAALGALQRLEVNSNEATALMAGFGTMEQDNQNDEADKTTVIATMSADSEQGDDQATTQSLKVKTRQGLDLHSEIVQQIYISAFTGGVLGVVGLIALTALTDLFGPLMPKFTESTEVALFADWLQIRPTSTLEYSKAILWCMLFGYSQRLAKNVLNRLDDIAEDYVGKFDGK